MRRTSATASYRPELDGLRAVAVLSVILFHLDISIADKNVLPGGFIGVDIFFVISGYLISTILINGIHTRGFSFMRFYERRARRILPILLLVVSVSLPFAWALLLPSGFVDYSYQLVTGIFFSSNFYFSLGDPYWAGESSLKPFLHTWSLSIEEQYYLLMPLILLFLIKATKIRVYHGIAVLLLLSLAYAQWMSSQQPIQSYYLLPSRAWELLAGAFLAAAPTLSNSNTDWKMRFLPTVGLLLLMFSVFWFDKQTLHPSLYTTIPIVGTMLLIYFANDRDYSIRLLKSRFLVGIGLISYGLYVWHFPVFAYAGVAGVFQDGASKSLLLLGVLGLSIVSYFLIERPFRDYRKTPPKFFLTFTAMWVLGLGFFAGFGLKDGYAFRVPQLVNQPAKPVRVKNHEWYQASGKNVGRVILAGDSHANVMAPALKRWALTSGFDFAKTSVSGCQLLADANRVRKADLVPRKNCTAETQSQRIDFILNSEPATVVLSGRLPLILEEDRFDNREGMYEGNMDEFIQDSSNSLSSKKRRQAFIRNKYLETVQKILDAGHRVVLIYPIPEVGWHVPRTLLKRIDGKFLRAREIAQQNPVTTSHEVFRRRTDRSYELLDQIQHENVARIYPEHLFCDNVIPGRCVTHDQEVSYYRDDDHLSEAGASLLVDEIKSVLQPRVLTSYVE